MSWDIVSIDMNYDCSSEMVKRVMHFMEYHWRVPRRIFGIHLYNCPIRVAWCLEHLNWNWDDWLHVLGPMNLPFRLLPLAIDSW